jgi:tetratricopeptide (TPR) repeat protein
MSGYKRATVTISEQEYRRLHQEDMKRRFGGHTKARKHSSKKSVDLTQSLRQMEDRQQQLEQALGTLNNDLIQSGAEAIQDVLEQNSLCFERLESVIQETRAGVGESFGLISQQLAQRLQDEGEHYRQGLQQLARRLDAYRHKEQAKEKLARQWLRRSVILSEFIQGQFDHERFRPGRLSKIMQRLDFAQDNLAGGSADASLQSSQQAFLDLSELHFELEQCILEWQAEHEQAQNALTEMLSEIRLNSHVTAFDLQGNALPEQVDLDYWTNGKYRLVLDQCKKFLTLLCEEQLSTEEMKQIRTDVLPVIAQYFDSVVYEARLNALNSQLRINIADRALQALECHGFQLRGAGYTGKDMRASFTVHLENADGSQVSIEVLPAQTKTQELANELIMISKHPHLKTEEEARLQWDELCRTFSQYQLNVSRPEIRSAAPAIQSEGEDVTLPNQQSLTSRSRSDVR